MAKWILVGMAVATLGLSLSCTSTAPTPPQAQLVVTLSPNPMPAIACPAGGCAANALSQTAEFQYRSFGAVTIQETGGAGVNVMAVGPRFPSLESRPSSPESPNSVIELSFGTNQRLAPHGILTVPFTVFYGRVDDTSVPRQMPIEVSVTTVDDAGRTHAAKATGTIN
jgi:hypothetical protein